MSVVGGTGSNGGNGRDTYDKRKISSGDDKSANNDADVRYKQCTKHKMDMILYCKHEACETEICPLCMSERHRDHSVANARDVQNQTLLDGLLQVLTSQRDVILAVKQGEENAFDCMMDRLKKKRQEITNQFEAMLQPIDEYIQFFGEMKHRTTVNDTFKDGEHNWDVLKAMVDNLREPKAYKTFEATVAEKQKSVHLKISLAHLTISRHVKKVRYICLTKLTEIYSLCALTDGSIVVQGLSQRFCVIQYDQKGRVIHSEDRYCSVNTIETDTGSHLILSDMFPKEGTAVTQVTVLADPDPFTSREQPVYDLDIGFVGEPLGTVSSSLLFLHKDLSSVTMVDFCTNPPTISTTRFKSRADNMQSLTTGCVQHDKKYLLITDGPMFGPGGIFAFDVTSRCLEWTLLRMPGETKNIDMNSMTADEDGHIFVYDRATRGILVVTTEGEFQEILLREGHEGIGEIQKMEWCKTLKSLAVAHKKHGKIHISLVYVNL